MKKLIMVLLVMTSTSALADEGILGALGSSLMRGLTQQQQQAVQLGTLVQAQNGQEYLVVQQASGQTFIQPVFVQRQGQGQYINN
jgi:hypothetical protein